MAYYYVYIVTNKNNTVVYTGVTNDLERRIYEHKQKIIKGFTAKYNLNKLVYFEQTENIESAILFEKKIKGWSRAKKNALINEHNSAWHDLSLNW